MKTPLLDRLVWFSILQLTSLHGFSPKRPFEYEQFGIIWNFPPLPKLAEMKVSPAF